MAKIGGGFSASPSAVHSHADRLSDRSSQVSDTGSRAQGAGLHGSALGAIGEGSAGSHQQLVGRLGSAAGRAGSGLRHQSDLLHRNASSMQDVEEQHRQSFERIDPSVRKGGPAGHQSPAPAGTGPGQQAPGTRPSARTTPRDTNENTDPRDTAVPGEGRVCKSDPVDIASGEVIMGQRDVELPGLLRLVFDRTHVSSYRCGRWFGPSWASTVDQRLEVGDAGVRFFAPDGMILVYPLPMAGEPTLPVEGPRWPLTLHVDGTLSLRDTTAEQTLHFDRPDPTDRTARLRAISGAAGHRIDLAYDAEGSPVELRHSGGYRVGLTVSARRITALRLIGTDATPDVPIMRYGYDDAGRLTEVVNSSGLPTLLRYDDAGRLAGWQDRNGVWYRYEYDEQGRCVRTVGADGFLSSQFAYDTERRRTTYTDSLGSVTTYELNPARQLVRETDPLGNVTSFEWDRYDRKLSETDPAGRVTRFAYDEDGRLARVDYPDGTSTSAVLSPTGMPATVAAPDGVHWLLGERGTTMLAGPDGVTTVSRGAPERGLVRNAAGLIIAETDESGATTRIEYDQFGRPAAVTGPQGGVTRHGWTVEGLPAWQVDPDGSRHSWRYDAEGNEIEYTDPAGRTTRTEYAGFDLPVAVTDPLGARTEYRYDTELRVTEIRAMQGLAWRYEYDPAGNVARTVDFDGRQRSYRYDPVGRVAAATDPAGVVTEFDHDVVGNTVAVRRPDGSTARYAYDGLDRLVRAITTDTELVLERDEFGRVVAETVDGRTVRTGYDLDGRMVRRETPSGAVSEWTFDATGKPVQLRTGGQTVAFGHDGLGRETARRLSRGFHLTQSYGMTDGPTTQAVASPAGRPEPVHRKDFRYRLGGDLAGVRTPAIGSHEFDVDAAGQVVGVRSADWQERYRYDAMGNVVFAQWPNSAIGSPATGERRYTGTVIESAGGVRYRHDASGRRVASESAAGVRRYVWDAGDRLVGVSDPDGTRWRYRYDGRGRRVAKQHLAADGTVLERTEFSWSDWQVVEQVRTAVDGGRHVITWDYHPTDGTVLTQVEQLLPAGSDTAVGVRWYTVLTDQVGTPTELFTPTGELVWQRRHTLWGLAESRGGVDIPLRFPGQYHDAETGLYYNTLRYYDPETARFLSPDPLGLVAALNPVSYVPNPLVWIDPLGLAKEQCAPSGSGGGPGKGDDPNGGKKPSGPFRKFGSKIKKAFQGGSRSSSRVQQAPSRYQDQRWWHENYGPSSTFGGGTGAHVQLGPASGDPIPGHSHLPGQNELTAVNQLGSPPWIKGHIVNSNLGGRNDSQNLTPLTSDANGSHLHNVETPIKNAVTTASQSGRFDRHDPYWYGVDFNTQVHHAGPIAPGNPQSAVAQHIDINSQYIRRPRVGDGPVEPVPQGQLPANRPWPQLPNGRLDPRTGAWTPAAAPAAPAVAGPSHTHAGSDGSSELSSPPPSNGGDTEMVDG